MHRIFVRGSNLGVRVVALAVLTLGLVGGLVAGTHKNKPDTLSAIEPAAVAATASPSVLSEAQDERRAQRDAKLYVSEVKQSAAAHAYAVAKAAAARKAAAKARAEAKAKAEAEAVRRLAAERASRSSRRVASQSVSGPSGGDAPAVPVDCESYSGIRQIGCSLLDWAGFATGQMSCLEPLWDHESGWRVSAQNASSGAYGVPQALPGRKMAEYGSDWQTNPVPQIKWGLMYIKGRYGDPCGAWSSFQSKGWY